MEQLALEFGAGRERAGCLRGGWADAERDLRWMIGVESQLVLPRPDDDARYLLSLKVAPHVRGEKLPSQTLICLVNGILAGMAELIDVATLNWEVPRIALDLDDSLTIRLIHPNAASPREIAGVGDDRKLAVALKALELKRINVIGAKASGPV